MATVTLTVAAAPYQRAVTAICTRYGYQATINGVPNVQTPQDFFKAWIILQVKNATKEHESNTAAASASTTAAADVETNLIIT